MTALNRRAGGALVLACMLGGGWAVAAPGDVKDLSKDLGNAVKRQDSAEIQKALEGLMEAGGEDAVKPILKIIPKLGKADDSVYWQLVSGASGFGDQGALAHVGEFIAKKEKSPYARDLLFGLENNPSPHVTAALSEILEEGPYDMQLMAADQLARIRTVASVDVLINQLKDEGDDGDPELKRRLMVSLGAITDESMGAAVNWIGWWEANRDKGLPERSADGPSGNLASQVLDPNRKEGFESLTRDPKRIVVISARYPDDDPRQPGKDNNYDHMEQILTQMEVPHTVVLKKEFNEDPDKYLKDAWTILVNCSNIHEYCICEECRKNIGGHAGNRMFSCPPNCPKGHDNVSYRLDNNALKKIKDWVEDGGYLFTEDWGIVEVIDTNWPELATSQGGNGDGATKIRALKDKDKPVGEDNINTGGSMDVVITPGRGVTSHPLMRGVFARPRPQATEDDAPENGGGTVTRDPAGMGGSESSAAPPSHQWKVDDESPAIYVKNAREITVLLESQELADCAEVEQAVAITFRTGNGGSAARKPARPTTGAGPDAGKSRGRGEFAERLRGGRVLHCLSHFGKQQQSRKDTFVLQNLILNFIMESNEQHSN